MAPQTGPRLTITGSCEGCCHRARTKIGGKHSAFVQCAHPSCTKSGAIFGDTAPTPAWCPELGRARLALFVSLASTLCRKCGRTVEQERECYAIPTCFACLPPPPPLPVLPSFEEWQRKQKEEAAGAAVPVAIGADSAARGAGEESE